jgi:hypothetical protein
MRAEFRSIRSFSPQVTELPPTSGMCCTLAFTLRGVGTRVLPSCLIPMGEDRGQAVRVLGI